MALRVHRGLTDFAAGCLFALLIQCAPTIPRVEIMPSGMVIINRTPLVRSSDLEATALCVADVWRMPREHLLTLTIEIANGYAVPCADTLSGGCYNWRERRIRIAAQPVSAPGGAAHDWGHSLVHEMQHFARHMTTGDPGTNADTDLPAEWCW